ncbi:acyl-CoA--sterol O-acyltransferase 1 [Ricinus communis]|uniref:Acyltransferase, putative n=1 Tax=Ricinus communis TaxID=3988 RepID=B9SPN0_RICCO|nr:acyl-CoA--sterol O-acyltransferase 1 [Ricinus communis]EEF34438.1 acyltransferase, putative [Ricinus communis]|eukprot:XP_002527949.1 acyl-CoA--sterol O-acyltransferase 1 [Ricinus communis]
MEGEIYNLICVWITVLVTLCYCYAIGKLVSQGTKRLLFILPVVCLFLFLPLNLFSPQLCGLTAFFIAWLANFKLLLFAFGKGPLSSDPSISLPVFVAVSCLPIKIQKNPSPKSHPKNSPNPSPNGQIKEDPSPKILKDGFLDYAVKATLVALMVRVYDYSDHIHPRIVLVIYVLHVYLFLELNLAITAALARIILGIELEPQFNDPYLSTSLQDFWGKRWNLMVTNILRLTVYEPICNLSSRALGLKRSRLLAVWLTFLVSALMHEVLFYYLARARPTGDISAFFLLNGLCLTAEINLKMWLNGRWQLPRLVSRFLTIGFVTTTGLWLFFPMFVRHQIDVRAFEDLAVLAVFLKNVGETVTGFWRGH